MKKVYILLIVISMLLFCNSVHAENQNKSSTEINSIIANVKNSKDEETKIKYVHECSVFVYNSKDRNLEIIELYGDILNNKKESITVRKIVAHGLGDFNREDAIEPLKRYVTNYNKGIVKESNVFKREQEAELFAEAVSSLGYYGAKTLPFLLELYKDKSVVADISDARMLGIIRRAGGINVVDILIDKTKAVEVSVRRSAIYGLSTIREEGGNIQDKINKQAAKLLNDNDGQVRELAVEILGKKMNDETYKLLLQISEKDSYSCEEIVTKNGKEEKVVRYPVREKALKSIMAYKGELDEKSKSSSSLEIKEKEYDLGSIEEGAEAKIILKLKNTGSDVLNIDSVSSDKNVELKCDFSKCKAVRVNEEGELAIAFLPLQNIEKQEYIIEIRSNDRNNPKICIKIVLKVIKDLK